VADLQAAINETGVVFVTAQIHEGWHQPRRWIDQSQPGRGNDRGHSFLLIGYDESGFWILNSWDDTWRRAGFAKLSYADWEANGKDAWVGQLGVKRSMGRRFLREKDISDLHHVGNRLFGDAG
jgi:hypothetical protein